MDRTYTVADAILDTLKAHGVSTIFGYPGGAILPFYDALPQHKEIEHILVRHEQAAAFAAQGWARSTKEIGVCCATSGPGATNLITGIADAYLDSIPMLCITGQVPLEMIGKDMFQEVDMTGMTLNISKHNYLVDKPEEIVHIVSEAIKIAKSGRPGPVHIDVPKDIMASKHPKNFKIPKIELTSDPQKQAYHPLENKITENVYKLLHKAKKPVIIAGQGIKHSRAEKKLKEFIDTLGIPTVSTLLAKGTLNEDNCPYYLGMLGMHGFYRANEAVHNADLIISIGSRFDDRIVGTYGSFGKHAKIVHVDIDRAELDKVVKTDISVHSDAKQFLRQMLVHPSIKKLEIDKWWKEIKKWSNEKPYQKSSKDFTIRSALNSLMSEAKKDLENFIFVTDVGQHQMWSSLNLEIPKTTQWLTSGGSGSMGFALPTAIGAAFANPEKTIICISGDGGIQMNIQELATIKDHNLNIKVCILNNNYLGMVRQWQELFYEHNYSEVLISSPDYKKLAEAYKIKGYTLKSQKEVEDKHKEIFHSKKPQVIDYQVLKEDNVFPMVPGGKTLGETIVG